MHRRKRKEPSSRGQHHQPDEFPKFPDGQGVASQNAKTTVPKHKLVPHLLIHVGNDGRDDRRNDTSHRRQIFPNQSTVLGVSPTGSYRLYVSTR